MTVIPVDRYMFTVDEVVAAILPNVGRAREIEMRIDADGYVVVDIVAPSSAGAVQSAPATLQADEDFPGDAPPPTMQEQPAGTPGPKEEEARELCSTPLFRAFLEVKTEEAAIKVLAGKCHVAALSDLDKTRSNAMNLRHVVEDFEAWKIT
jgi:hypothetical protein